MFIEFEELGNEHIPRCSHSRKVHFPEDDTQLVTGYHEAPTNAFHLKQCHDTITIADAYLNACKLANVPPNSSVEHQIARTKLTTSCVSLFPSQVRTTVSGQRLSQAHMECLEEIFKRVQFDTLDFEYTFIDDDAAVSLAEMLEFYDSTAKLNLSFNKQINIRGWQALFRAIKNCHSLQLLNLRYTSLSDKAVPFLARTLRTQSTLTTLHLENVSLSGRNLLLLVCALKVNIVLKELYLGENNLQPTDGAHLYQLIVGSTSLQMLDLRNNQLQDGGLRHLCDALRNKETLEKSALSALVLWNNRLTSGSMDALADALLENSKLETLNIGSNNLSVEGIVALKRALLANSSLQRLGLQATNLDCQSAIVLAECIADNKVMVRIDLRDNLQIGSAGLLALHLAMKMNTSITLLNLDYSCAKSNSAKVKEYHEQFKLYFDEIKSFCDRNKQAALKRLSVQSSVTENNPTESESVEDAQRTKNEQQEKSDVNETTENLVETAVLKSENDVNSSNEVNERQQKRSPPPLCRQKSVEVQSNRSVPPVWKFSRSSSLTCTELVEDINERILQMSRSRVMSTNETGVSEETNLNPELGKSPSLPVLPLLANATDSTTTIKKPSPNRRFSVSLSTHSNSNPELRRSVSPRFKVMPVTSSSAHTLSQSTPAITKSVHETKASPSQHYPSSDISALPNTPVSTNASAVNGTSKREPKIVHITSKDVDENGNSTLPMDFPPSKQTERSCNTVISSDVEINSESTVPHDGSSTETNCSVSFNSPITPNSADAVDSMNYDSNNNNNDSSDTNNNSNNSKKEDSQKELENMECVQETFSVKTTVFDAECSHEDVQLHSRKVHFSEVVPVEIIPQATTTEERKKQVNCDTNSGGCDTTAAAYDVLEMNEKNNCRRDDESLDLNQSGSESEPMPQAATVFHADECSQESVDEQHKKLAFTLDTNPSTSGNEAATTCCSGENCVEKGDQDNATDTISESSDFVFVVDQSTEQESLPDGCSIEVVPELLHSSKHTSNSTDCDCCGTSSQSHSQNVTSNGRNCLRKLDQTMTYASMKSAEETNAVDGSAKRDKCIANVVDVSNKKPPDIDVNDAQHECFTLKCVKNCDTEMSLNSELVGCEVSGEQSTAVLRKSSEDSKNICACLGIDRNYEYVPASRQQSVSTGKVENASSSLSASLPSPSQRLSRSSKGALNLLVDVSDDAVVRRVVQDLVNFTSFEMGDDVGFRSAGSKSPSPSRYMINASQTVACCTPRNAIEETRDCCTNDPDIERVVHCVVRGLVRDVLVSEKSALSRNLRRRRERLHK
ncbi:unnamed protein product [Anisakis simplex]|uniref:Protein phosphatase 1 regulatory subunit 37 homolog (inferred by orthology to a C. elegans protein) n=1 Tax=Anisakis simplex TaxID=6269 RepID=A0A0M3JY30_ANISI|nr:unnamed protein product [Anisakis simplex]